jgi:periplasmic glucans biosynthesis protein
MMNRRSLLASTARLAVVAAAAGIVPVARSAFAAQTDREGSAFSYDLLVERARGMAGLPFEPVPEDLPGPIADLSYDQYRDIRFRPEEALWRDLGLPFRTQFFHPGSHFKRPVHIYEVHDGIAREVLYDPTLFDLGANSFDSGLSSHLGFAGFRLHFPLNRPDYFDELAVFLGASYFRALGQGQRYGLSARGLAIDTALQSGEEFPYFREFWLERPAPGATDMRIYALLDSPSIAGAYSLVIRPGVNTVMDVTATLFPRTAVEKLGIAPLTSMFLFSEHDRRGFDDFRPQVHDSQGLSMWTGTGEWIWRPLVNPQRLRVSSFSDENPRGFGLLQRNRNFDDYQDLEARYDRRPSLWVEPTEQWGKGVVQLIEIPTDSEANDNIVAFWIPEQPVEGGSEWRLAYRLHWCLESPQRPPNGEAVSTRSGTGGSEDDVRKFVIDFKGGQLFELKADSEVVPDISITNGEIINPVAQPNPVIEGWRVFFDVRPTGSGPVEMRCFLKLSSDALTETWSYQWTP